jgi:TatD DNase family protein
VARLIDTHCHLTHARLASALPEVLGRARQAGLVAIICAGANIRESRDACALAHRQKDVYFTAGLHPHDAKGADQGYLKTIEDLAADPRNVAIGEIGLDYHYNFSPPEAQRQVFRDQLALAKRLGKKIVIHTREAFDDTLAIIRESRADGGRIVFHSFTEAPADARRALEIGATISFSGIVTFRTSDLLRQSAAIVPDDRILVETDAPYLSPEPVRKTKTNEPANVAHVCACLAAVRKTAEDQLAELTTANAVRFFDLKFENQATSG